MRSKLTAGMPQITASIARRSIMRWASSLAEYSCSFCNDAFAAPVVFDMGWLDGIDIAVLHSSAFRDRGNSQPRHRTHTAVRAMTEPPHHSDDYSAPLAAVELDFGPIRYGTAQGQACSLRGPADGRPDMPKYRCYLFDEANERQRAIDFEAASDEEACVEADRLHDTW